MPDYSSKVIEHKGIIKSINNRMITVELESVSACGSCYAKNVCYVAEKDIKTIEIFDCDREYAMGDEVIVLLSQTMGLKALLLGYILPFLVFISSLFIASNLIEQEVVAGLIAIGVIIFYYGSLYFFKKRLKQTFKFKIK